MTVCLFRLLGIVSIGFRREVPYLSCETRALTQRADNETWQHGGNGNLTCLMGFMRSSRLILRATC